MWIASLVVAHFSYMPIVLFVEKHIYRGVILTALLLKICIIGISYQILLVTSLKKFVLQCACLNREKILSCAVLILDNYFVHINLNPSFKTF